MDEPNQNAPNPEDNANGVNNRNAAGANNNANQAGANDNNNANPDLVGEEEMLQIVAEGDNDAENQVMMGLIRMAPAGNGPDNNNDANQPGNNIDQLFEMPEIQREREEDEREQTRVDRIDRMMNERPVLTEENAHLTNMPNEMLAQIFQSMSTTGRLDMEAVSSQWKAISQKHSWCLTKHLQIFPTDIIGKRRLRPFDLRDRSELQALDAKQYFDRLFKWCSLYVTEFTITHILGDDRFFERLHHFDSLSHILLYQLGYQVVASDFIQIAKNLPRLKSLFIVKCTVHYNYWQGLEFLFERCDQLEIFYTYMLDVPKSGFFNDYQNLPASLRVLQLHSGSVEDWVWWRRVMEIARARCPRLSALLFRDSMVSSEVTNPNETFQRFAEYNNLICLDLRHCNLSTENVMMLEPVLSRLKSFTCSKIQTNLIDMLQWGRQLEHFGFGIDYTSNFTLSHLNELLNMPNLRSIELYFFSIPQPPAALPNIPSNLRTRDGDYADVLREVAKQGRLEYLNTNLMLSHDEALSIIKHSPNLKALYSTMREAEIFFSRKKLSLPTSVAATIMDRRRHVKIRHASRFNFIQFNKGLEKIWADKGWDLQNHKLKMCINPPGLWYAAPVDFKIVEEMPPVTSEFIDYQYQPTESHVILEVAARSLTETPQILMNILDLVMFEERQKLHDRRADRDGGP